LIGQRLIPLKMPIEALSQRLFRQTSKALSLSFSTQGEYRTYGSAGAEPKVILKVLDDPAADSTTMMI
jgi:hypothetical protein